LSDRIALPHRGHGDLMNNGDVSSSRHESLPYAGEPTADFRERLARQQAEASERRAHALIEQSSVSNSPQARIRIWEQLHAIVLPRNASHRLVDVIAANTGLTVQQVREEQQQRAALAAGSGAGPAAVGASPP
jgi:hypothetical protein